MFHLLKRKLIFLYTATTGTILTVVFIIAALLNEQQYEFSLLRSFENSFYSLQSKLQLENVLSDAWLSDLESSERLIIHIADNNSPIFFTGVWKPETSRELLLEKVTAAAQAEGVLLDTRPISANIISSSLMTIEGLNGDRYYASAAAISQKRGFRSLILLQYIPDGSPEISFQRLSYILLDLMGIFALFIVCRLLVGRSLRPIQENQKRQAEFIAAASHELRSPLAVIRLQNSGCQSDDSSHRLIEQECVRMSRLINDMLTLASGDAGTWSVKEEAVDSDTLIIDAYEAFCPAAAGKNISLELKLPDDKLPNLVGDKERLQQILSIFIDNAINYSPEASVITIKAMTERKHLIIEIADHGSGISDESKPYIFDRFYRADASRKDKQHFGLGLSIAYELLQLHHATVRLYDTEGGGCTFVLRFPAGQA